jgi:hypothetical protein
VSEAQCVLVFDSGTCKCQSIKCSCRGSGYGGGEPATSSSEAGPHPSGRPSLERGGTSPEGATGPRARWRFTSVVSCPSSEVEFRPRVAGPTVLVGRWGHRCRGPICWAVIFFEARFGFICVLLFAKKWVFLGCLGDPYGYPRHIEQF